MLQRHQQSMSRLFGKHWQSGGRKAPIVENIGPFYLYYGLDSSRNNTGCLYFDPVYGAKFRNARGNETPSFPNFSMPQNVVFGDIYPFAFFPINQMTIAGITLPDLSAYEWFSDLYDIIVTKANVDITTPDFTFTQEMVIFGINGSNVTIDNNGYYKPYDLGSKVYSPACKFIIPKADTLDFKTQTNMIASRNDTYETTDKKSKGLMNIDMSYQYSSILSAPEFNPNLSYVDFGNILIPAATEYDGTIPVSASSVLPFPHIFSQYDMFNAFANIRVTANNDFSVYNTTSTNPSKSSIALRCEDIGYSATYATGWGSAFSKGFTSRIYQKDTDGYVSKFTIL